MIRIFFSSAFQRQLRGFSEDERNEIGAALSGVLREFGNPHGHSGLGLRKIGRDLWECRVGLELRIVFLKESDGLVAHGVMNHDQVRAWIKNLK